MNVGTLAPGSSQTRRTSHRGLAGATTIALAAAGVVALGQSAAAGDADRIGGSDRVDTAIKVWEQNRSLYAADRVIITRADSYADSLTATPLAVATKTPILITPSGDLDDRVLAAIKRQGVKNVAIVGGEKAVSPAVMRELEANGMRTGRLAGADRYETSRLIADAVLTATGKTSAPAFVATGINFPDALAAGAAAAESGGYVLLSGGSNLDDATAGYLRSNKASAVNAVGGPAVTAVNRKGINATPITGVNRYETAVKLAEAVYTKPANVVVASGMTFADSLAGGVLAGLRGAPLLLTPPNTIEVNTARYLVAVQPDVVVLGGPAAVSADTVAKIDVAADGVMPPLDPNTPAPTPTAPPTTTPPPTNPGGGGGGGVVAPTYPVLASLIARGEATYTGSGTATVNGGTVDTRATLSVRSDGSYTLTQEFNGSAQGATGQQSATSDITLTGGGQSIVLNQVFTATSTSAVTGSGRAVLTTNGRGTGTTTATMSVDSITVSTLGTAGDSVTARVTSTLGDRTINTATATATTGNRTPQVSVSGH